LLDITGGWFIIERERDSSESLELHVVGEESSPTNLPEAKIYCSVIDVPAHKAHDLVVSLHHSIHSYSFSKDIKGLNSISTTRSGPGSSILSKEYR
jgi:hypothetical protein